MNTAPCSMHSPSDNPHENDVKAAIRKESQMEAQCDILISRLQDELREAKRSGSPRSLVEMHAASIKSISIKREEHRENIASLRRH